MCILMPYKWLDYCIAENFWGRKLLWIGEKYGFHGETFCRFLTCAAPKDVIPQISRINLFMSSHKTVKICESLLPRRFCYTAFCQKKFHIWWYSISIKIAQNFQSISHHAVFWKLLPSNSNCAKSTSAASKVSKCDSTVQPTDSNTNI